jgi:hypothetical protein
MHPSGRLELADAQSCIEFPDLSVGEHGNFLRSANVCAEDCRVRGKKIRNVASARAASE